MKRTEILPTEAIRKIGRYNAFIWDSRTIWNLLRRLSAFAKNGHTKYPVSNRKNVESVQVGWALKNGFVVSDEPAVRPDGDSYFQLYIYLDKQQKDTGKIIG